MLGNAAAVDPSPQERLEVVSDNLAVLPQWSDLLRRMEADSDRLAACDADIEHCASNRWVAWIGKLRSLQSLSTDEVLVAVNRYVNAYPPKDDPDNYQLQEYWASPTEFLEKSGDDEDAAVMKYFMLRHHGIAATSLRIVRLWDSLEGRQETVLLFASPGGEFQVLSRRQELLFPLSQMRYSTPVYGVNEQHYWFYINP